MKKRIKYKYVNLFVICLFTFLIVLHFKKINQSYKSIKNTNNFLEVEEESADIISVDKNMLVITYDKLSNNYLTIELETESEEVVTKEETIVKETESETDIQLNYIDMDTPSNNSFKAYMDYRYITDRTSNQWMLQQQAYTNEYGIRMIDDRYCIAVGSYYTTVIGTKIDLIMENGSIIKCILGDCKADIHTDAETHRYNPNGGIAEFVVDENVLIPFISTQWGNTGNVSNLDDRFQGEIKYMRIYKN